MHKSFNTYLMDSYIRSQSTEIHMETAGSQAHLQLKG